jgi:RNA polymerase sigma-70 factor (ECF subfamily)
MPGRGTEEGLWIVDEQDYHTIVRQQHDRLLAYALAIVRRREAAEDLVQDAFVTACRNLAKSKPIRDYALWLRGILRMKYLEWTRARKAVPLDEAVIDAIEQEHRAWDQAAEDGRGDALQALQDCLEGLEGVLRETVELFYLRDIPCAEIAARLGATETATKKRLQRARESLADCVRTRLDLIA